MVTAIHFSAHQIAVKRWIIKGRQIAQEFKCLGISFTYYLRGLISVENIYKLPWVTVSYSSGSSTVIVCSVVAYIRLIVFQLVVIGCAAFRYRFFHHLNSLRYGIARRTGLSGINIRGPGI